MKLWDKNGLNLVERVLLHSHKKWPLSANRVTFLFRFILKVRRLMTIYETFGKFLQKIADVYYCFQTKLRMYFYKKK